MTSFCTVSRKPIAMTLAGCLMLGACAQPSGSVYTRNDVGQVIEMSQGTVVASRTVRIEDTRNGSLGAAGGAAAGGVIGNQFGSGKGNALATLAGVLIGAGVGYMAERQARSGTGTEYLVEMDDGRVVTIVQNQATGDQVIADGQPVMVQYGSEYTRIVPLDDRAAAAAAAGGGASGGASGGTRGGGDEWQNPDLVDDNSPYDVYGTNARYDPYEPQSTQQ